jgi:hypothetical protein
MGVCSKPVSCAGLHEQRGTGRPAFTPWSLREAKMAGLLRHSLQAEPCRAECWARRHQLGHWIPAMDEASETGLQNPDKPH